MAANTKPSIWQVILGIFKSLFGMGGKKTPTIPNPDPIPTPNPNPNPNTNDGSNTNNNTGGNTNNNNNSGGNNTTTPTDLPEDATSVMIESSVNDAVLRYGGGYLTITKSKKFVAVKKDNNFSPATLHRNLPGAPPPEEAISGKKLGDFEILEPVEATLEEVEQTLDNMRESPEVSVGTHVFHNTEHKDETPMVPTGEIYVVLTDNANLTAAADLLKSFHLNIKEQRSAQEMIVEITPASPNPIKVCVALQASNMVKIAEPELLSPIGLAFNLPSDELLKDQWHLENKGTHGRWSPNSFKAGSDAKVVDAWKHLRSLGNRNLVVAVLDDGFDMNHADLRGDGTKIVHPWDFETESPDPSPRMGNWHGTPCAGVAIGAADGTGIVGAAPDCKLMPLRFDGISDSRIERWFSYVQEKGADVMSNSWGSPSASFVMSSRMIQAIHRAATKGRNGKGCVIVFASGNSTRSISHPTNSTAITGFATHPDVIAVAASNSKDQASNYSNFGHQISVCAPSNGSSGAGVTTADVGGTLLLPSGSTGFKGYDEGRFTHGFGGTSSACPLVAGVAALILTANPNLTASQVKRILETTTDKIGVAHDYDINGHSQNFGFGRINALKAVKKAQGANIPEDEPSTITDTPVIEAPTPPPPVAAPQPADIIEQPFEALIDGHLSKTGQENYYKISLNGQLTVEIDSPVGDEDSDFDLYLRKWKPPTTGVGEYDMKSNTFGSKEKITVHSAGSATYFALISAYQGNGGYNFAATLKRPVDEVGIKEVSLVAMSGGILLKNRRPHVIYKFGMHKQLKVNVHAPIGLSNNFDLYVRRGIKPKWNEFDGRGIKDGSNEVVTLNDPTAGDYYILVRSREGVGDYKLQIQLT